MRGYFEHRGASAKLFFDPITKSFESRPLNHPFTDQRDELEMHLLADLGVDIEALDCGELKFAA
jgi:hypothetical protein